jgi:hypothetical protein
VSREQSSISVRRLCMAWLHSVFCKPPRTTVFQLSTDVRRFVPANLPAHKGRRGRSDDDESGDDSRDGFAEEQLIIIAKNDSMDVVLVAKVDNMDVVLVAKDDSRDVVVVGNEDSRDGVAMNVDDDDDDDN